MGLRVSGLGCRVGFGSFFLKTGFVRFWGLVGLYRDVSGFMFGFYMELEGLYSFACFVQDFFGLSAGP